MQKGRRGAGPRKRGKLVRRPAARRWSALAWSFAISCGLAGCATQKQGTAAPYDPLLGGPPARPATRLPVPTAAATPLAPVPAAPTANSLTSAAALAGGAPRPLDNSNDLRIHETPHTPDSRYGDGQKSWGGPVLHAPEPVAAQPPGPAAYTPVAAGNVRTSSFEQAMEQLTARGVTWYELKTWGDGSECKFTCSVPVPHKDNISRNYEARARHYLEAMQAVLTQIDRERQ